MILTEQKDIQVLSDGEQSESIKMSLDIESSQMLMQMLSKNLYSDEIGSTVRELASNALDSHRRAGVTDKPIIVSLNKNEYGSYEFAVEDFGVGLDADDVVNIIRKYGKSLARTEANALGMMGLGFKSPLAYTSTFYFIGRKNGVERKYMMYEGEEGNAIDLLYESPTTEGNGVKVIVPIHYFDRENFIKKIKEQLAYFEDVYYNLYSSSNNDFKIFRSDEYQYSENSVDTALHICLDNVYYPIDFNKLGISRIEAPIGLRFTLADGIFPTPNREALRYTAETKVTILNKIKIIADLFINKFNESITETEDIEDIFKYYKDKRREVYVTDASGSRVFDVMTFVPFSEIAISKPKLKGVEILNLEKVYDRRDKILGEYRIKYDASKYRIKELNKRKSSEITISSLKEKKYYLYEATMGMNKKEYLKSLLGYDVVFLVRKVEEYKLGYRSSFSQYVDSYSSIISLKKYPRDQWRTVIKEYQFIQSLFLAKFTNIDKIEIPQEWLDARKKKRLSMSLGGNRRIKLQGELSCKLATPLERFVSGKNCKFTATTLKYEALHKIGALIVYDTHDNSDKLDELYEITHHLKIRCMTFSEREIRNVEKYEIHNLISYKKFMEGNNKPFKRLVTTYLIKKLIDEQAGVFSRSFPLKTISNDLVEKVVKLKEYKKSNYQELSYNNTNTKIYETMLEVAEEHNLYDMEIYSTYKEIKTFLEKLPFVNTLIKQMDTYENYEENKALIEILRDMFKYYKVRIDYTNYNIVMNDTTWMDELLDAVEVTEEEEEVIEEVVEEEEIQSY